MYPKTSDQRIECVARALGAPRNAGRLYTLPIAAYAADYAGCQASGTEGTYMEAFAGALLEAGVAVGPSSAKLSVGHVMEAMGLRWNEFRWHYAYCSGSRIEGAGPHQVRGADLAIALRKLLVVRNGPGQKESLAYQPY